MEGVNYINMEITYAKAITEIKSNADFTIYDGNLDNIIWHDDNPTSITKAQILAKQTELQTVEDAKPENVNKTSAQNKLKALGLTDAEIEAL